jgi:cellobiose-specific phosphotransferase system component IIA
MEVEEVEVMIEEAENCLNEATKAKRNIMKKVKSETKKAIEAKLEPIE